MDQVKLCSIDGCGKSVIARGWCETHYRRWKRHGHPLSQVVNNHADAIEYLVNFVLKYDGDKCLPWPFDRVKTRDGRFYGRATVGGKSVLVSRYVCEKVHGPAPTPEHQAAHSCGQGHRACVAPNHVSWKTPSENQSDRIEHGTHDRGERSSNAKITEEIARLIKASKGVETQSALAERFRISQSNVSSIQNGKRWGWLQF